MLIELRERMETSWMDLPQTLRARWSKENTKESVALQEVGADTPPVPPSKQEDVQTVTFRINWSASDKRLMGEFEVWIKAARKREAKEQRGRNRRDDLNMLGALRLLHSMKLREATILTIQAKGEPLYGKRPSWERARKMALRVFREDFLIGKERWKEEQMPLSYNKLEKEETGDEAVSE